MNNHTHNKARLDLEEAEHLLLPLPELLHPHTSPRDVEGLGLEVGGVLGALKLTAPRGVEGLGLDAGGAGWFWLAAGGGGVLGLEAGGVGRCWPPVGGEGVNGDLVHNDRVGEGLGLEAGGAGQCWPPVGGERWMAPLT